MDNQKMGKEGEDVAARYLSSLGFTILERNYKCRYGEIDIIALDRGILCFVEVKTRSRTDYGLPCQAVDWKKERHIRRCAYVYIKEHHMENLDKRIDIVEVLKRNGRFYIRRIVNGRNG